MKLYEVKALAHETQSRIRQDLNAWNDFLEHASRVYRYRFMDQILIYAQRPDAVACATMNIWNSKMGCWIKKGNRGIALIDESNSRKLVLYLKWEDICRDCGYENHITRKRYRIVY